MDDITQFGQSSLLCIDDLVESRKHLSISVLVQIQLHTQALCRLHLLKSVCAGQDYHHPVIFNITYLPHKLHVTKHFRCILLEKANGFSRLKLMFHILLRHTIGHLNHQLVKRIVIVPTYIQRIPTKATPNFAFHAHCLRLPLELFFLILVFQLKQLPLPNQFLNHVDKDINYLPLTIYHLLFICYLCPIINNKSQGHETHCTLSLHSRLSILNYQFICCYSHRWVAGTHRPRGLQEIHYSAGKK